MASAWARERVKLGAKVMAKVMAKVRETIQFQNLRARFDGA